MPQFMLLLGSLLHTYTVTSVAIYYNNISVSSKPNLLDSRRRLVVVSGILDLTIGIRRPHPGAPFFGLRGGLGVLFALGLVRVEMKGRERQD